MTPGRAATTECCRCHYIFPKPEMRQVRKNIGGGFQPGRRTDRYTRDGKPTGYSQTQDQWRSGRTITLWYCATCYVAYARSRRRFILGFAALLSLLIALPWILGIGVNGAFHERKSSVTSPRTAPAIEPTPSSTLVATTPANAKEIDPKTALPTDQENSGPTSTIAKPDPLRPPHRMTPEESPELRRAMSKALATGIAQRWRDGETAGWVVVSPIEQQSGCRSEYYSIDTPTPAWNSPNQTICPEQK